MQPARLRGDVLARQRVRQVDDARYWGRRRRHRNVRTRLMCPTEKQREQHGGPDCRANRRTNRSERHHQLPEAPPPPKLPPPPLKPPLSLELDPLLQPPPPPDQPLEEPLEPPRPDGHALLKPFAISAMKKASRAEGGRCDQRSDHEPGNHADHAAGHGRAEQAAEAGRAGKRRRIARRRGRRGANEDSVSRPGSGPCEACGRGGGNGSPSITPIMRVDAGIDAAGEIAGLEFGAMTSSMMRRAVTSVSAPSRP